MAGPTIECSIPYFKRALEELLRSIPILNAGQTVISWGNPHPNHWPREVVIIGDTSNRIRTWTAGHTQATEEYDVVLKVNVTGNAINPSADPQNRAWKLANAIESALLEWVLSPTPFAEGDWGYVFDVDVSTASDQGGLDETSRDATVTLTLHVRARVIRHG